MYRIWLLTILSRQGGAVNFWEKAIPARLNSIISEPLARIPPNAKHGLVAELPINPENFVKIVQGILPHGTFLSPNFVKFTVLRSHAITIAPMGWNLAWSGPYRATPFGLRYAKFHPMVQRVDPGEEPQNRPLRDLNVGICPVGKNNSWTKIALAVTGWVSNRLQQSIVRAAMHARRRQSLRVGFTPLFVCYYARYLKNR